MRTPWRFVADLVSRKPKEGTSEDTHSKAGEIKVLEHQPANEEQMLDGETNAPAPSEEGGREKETLSTLLAPDVRPGISPASREINYSTNIVSQSAAGEQEEVFDARVEEPAVAARVPERAPRRKLKPAIGNTAADIASDVDAPAAPNVPKTLIEEMADVDAEVDVLRRELVKKLTEQNTQLRKMLSRFETH